MSHQQRSCEELADRGIWLRRLLLQLPNLHQATVACFPLPDDFDIRIDFQHPFLESLARESFVPHKAWLVGQWASISLETRGRVELEDAFSLAYVEAVGFRSEHAAVKQVETLTLDLESRQTLHNLLSSSSGTDDDRAKYMLRRQNVIKA